MAEFDPIKFKAFLEAGKKAEAEAYAKECLDSDISNEENGKALLNHALSYMKAVNSVNEAYKKDLEDVLSSLQKNDQEEKEEIDEVDLLKVRTDLNS
jgi:hypothetical protein